MHRCYTLLFLFFTIFIFPMQNHNELYRDYFGNTVQLMHDPNTGMTVPVAIRQIPVPVPVYMPMPPTAPMHYQIQRYLQQFVPSADHSLNQMPTHYQSHGSQSVSSSQGHGLLSTDYESISSDPSLVIEVSDTESSEDEALDEVDDITSDMNQLTLSNNAQTKHYNDVGSNPQSLWKGVHWADVTDDDDDRFPLAALPPISKPEEPAIVCEDDVQIDFAEQIMHDHSKSAESSTPSSPQARSLRSSSSSSGSSYADIARKRHNESIAHKKNVASMQKKQSPQIQESVNQKLMKVIAHRKKDQKQSLPIKPRASQNKVIDQSHISHEEFYEGYTPAISSTHVRSDGVVMCAEIVEEKASQKKEKKSTPKKKKSAKKRKQEMAEKKKLAKKGRKKANSSSGAKPRISKPEKPKKPIKRQIESLINGDFDQKKKALKLYEQVADGAAHDESIDDEFKIEAARIMLGHYARGAKDAKSKKTLVQQNFNRAAYFAQKAIEYGSIFGHGDMAQITFQQGDVQKAIEHCDTLTACDDAADYIKDFARCFKGAMLLMQHDPEREFPQLLKQEVCDYFKMAHDRYQDSGANMHKFAHMFPDQFYDWVSGAMKAWEKDEFEGMDAHDIEWFYLMGRMYLDGACTNGTNDIQRFTKQKHAAIGWVKVAADKGHWPAKLFLSSCHDCAIPDYARVAYLENAMREFSSRSKKEQEAILQECDRFVQKGYLAPLVRIMTVLNAENDVDSIIRTLEKNFPTCMHIGRGNGACYKKAQDFGLLKTLQEKAQKPEGWVSRALLSALEFAYERDTNVVQKDTLPHKDLEKMIEDALERVKKDTKDHPEVRSVVAAGYSTLADVYATSVVLNHCSQDEKTSRIKKVKKLFERSIELGDEYGMLTYGVLLVREPDLFASNTKDRKQAVAYLEKLSRDTQSECSLLATRDLIRHYAAQSQTGTARQYIKKMRSFFQSAFLFDAQSTQFIDDLENELKSANTTSTKKSDRTPESKKDSHKKYKQFSQTQAEKISRMKRGAIYLDKAFQKAKNQDPIQALRLLQNAFACDIGMVLEDNPHLIAKYHMAIDDMCRVIKDPTVVEPQVVPLVEEKLHTYIEMLAQAHAAYEIAFHSPGYEPIRYEAIFRQYLRAHQWHARIIAINEIDDTKDRLEKVQELVDEMIPAGAVEPEKVALINKYKNELNDDTQFGVIVQESCRSYLAQSRQNCEQSFQESQMPTLNVCLDKIIPEQKQIKARNIEAERANSLLQAAHNLFFAGQSVFTNPLKSFVHLCEAMHKGIDVLLVNNPWIVEQYQCTVEGLIEASDLLPAEKKEGFLGSLAPFMQSIANAQQSVQTNSNKAVVQCCKDFIRTQKHYVQWQSILQKDSIKKRYEGALLMFDTLRATGRLSKDKSVYDFVSINAAEKEQENFIDDIDKTVKNDFEACKQEYEETFFKNPLPIGVKADEKDKS